MEGRGIPQERIFLEKLSGKDTKRPMLQSLMSRVQHGDTVDEALEQTGLKQATFYNRLREFRQSKKKQLAIKRSTFL